MLYFCVGEGFWHFYLFSVPPNCPTSVSRLYTVIWVGIQFKILIGIDIRGAFQFQKSNQSNTLVFPKPPFLPRHTADIRQLIFSHRRLLIGRRRPWRARSAVGDWRVVLRRDVHIKRKTFRVPIIVLFAPTCADDIRRQGRLYRIPFSTTPERGTSRSAGGALKFRRPRNAALFATAKLVSGTCWCYWQGFVGQDNWQKFV